jgi:hypothetical protein
MSEKKTARVAKPKETGEERYARLQKEGKCGKCGQANPIGKDKKCCALCAQMAQAWRECKAEKREWNRANFMRSKRAEDGLKGIYPE